MNQIDCKQAQNVWSRVMAAQAGAQSTSANPPVQGKAAQVEQPASITPEQLLSSIEYEMLDAVTYQCLAARMSGCAQKTLRALSQDERRHAKELSAMYFLLTGKKVCPKKPDSPASPATPRLYDGSIRASLPRATAMKRLHRSPGPEPARCGKSRSTSAATPRNSMSCSRAASERA